MSAARLPRQGRKKISVSVKPSAKKTRVVALDDGRFLVAVHEPARDGKANEGVLRAIASHFSVAPSAVRIVSGRTARQKIVEIG